MTTPYIDPNLIFAENAPVQDKPAAFENYDKGWDESRKNDGRPRIPQMNYLQQQADLKNRYIHENGAALPYKEGVAYEENAVVVKDGMLQQLRNGEWAALKLTHYTLGSVSELLSVPSPQTGDCVYVKSYIAGAGKGAGTYVYDSAKSNINDGVLCINGWCLVSTPDIFSGGILANGSDDTAALQRTYDALHSLGMDIDLLGNTIKTVSLDIDSNTVIKNGTLDVYAWGGMSLFPESNWRRTPIMLKNNPRNSTFDFEYASKYTQLLATNNIKFINVKFKAKRRLFVAYKVNDLLFDGCEFEWDSHEIINIIGGWQGTSYVSDDDTSTNILSPVNGYCENITIRNNKFRGLTPTISCSATHLVANRNVTICNNEYYNVPLGSRVDTWNTEVDVFGNKYLYTDPDALAMLAANASASDRDFIGVYVGQNTHNVNIYGNTFDGVYRPIYVEVGSNVDIWGNTFKNRIGKLWWSYAIVLQGNWRDLNNVYWGNATSITIRENKFVDFGSSIATSTTPPAGQLYGQKDIIVKDNIILGHSGHPSIILAKTYNVVCTDNFVEGNIRLDTIGGNQVVSRNDVTYLGGDSSVYPLVIQNVKGTYVDATNNKLRSNNGECVRLLNTTGSSTNLSGSLMIPNVPTKFISRSNVGAIFGIISTSYQTSFSRSVSVDLAAGAIGTYTLSIPNIRSVDNATVTMQSINSLWSQRSLAIDFEYEATDGGVNLRIKNIGSAPVSFSPVFFIHFQVVATSL